MRLLVLLMLSNFLILFQGQAHEECGAGVIEYIDDRKTVKENLTFCVEQDELGSYLYSLSCKAKQCKPLTEFAMDSIDISKGRSDIGSPYFKLCRELGGRPQIISFSLGKIENYKTDRCLFGEDTFISNDLLMKTYRDNVIF